MSLHTTTSKMQVLITRYLSWITAITFQYLIKKMSNLALSLSQPTNY